MRQRNGADLPGQPENHETPGGHAECARQEFESYKSDIEKAYKEEMVYANRYNVPCCGTLRTTYYILPIVCGALCDAHCYYCD